MKYAFSAVFTREDGGYSALCPELGVSSQGNTIEEAESNIKEAVTLYIEDMTHSELAPYARVQKEKPLLKTFEVVHA